MLVPKTWWSERGYSENTFHKPSQTWGSGFSGCSIRFRFMGEVPGLRPESPPTQIAALVAPEDCFFLAGCVFETIPSTSPANPSSPSSLLVVSHPMFSTPTTMYVVGSRTKSARICKKQQKVVQDVNCFCHLSHYIPRKNSTRGAYWNEVCTTHLYIFGKRGRGCKRKCKYNVWLLK